MNDLPGLEDPARLRALDETGLLDSTPEAEFDRLAQIAARLLDAPAAFVMLVGADRQYIKSAVGQTGTTPEAGTSMGLDRSISKHAVASDAALVVEDAHLHPLVKDNEAVAEGVIAYAGIPLHGPRGHAIGALCVVDSNPRQWTDRDIDTLRSVAASAETLIWDREPSLAEARVREERIAHPDELLATVAEHLRASADYEQLVAGSAAIDFAEEAKAQFAVIETTAQLRDTFRRYAPASEASANPLAEAVRRYVDANAKRREISSAFAAGAVSLAELEGAIARHIDAADVLRIVALDCGAIL